MTAIASLGCATSIKTSTVEVLADAILAPGGSSLISFTSPPDVAYFDVNVTNPLGALVTEVLHRSPATSQSTGIEVYIQSAAGASVVGNEAASNFTLVASGSATSPGLSDRLFAIDVNDFVLPPGVTGVAVVSTSGGQTFWDNARGFMNSNADMTITAHSADSDFSTAANGLIEVASWAGGFITTPVDNLYADFSANVFSGNSPLTVQFSDLSVTNAPAGISTWAWDFQDDGIVDSTQQNPTFVYGTCGEFDVRLTVQDALNGSRTVTKANFIATDLIDASFTQSQNFASIGDTVSFTWTGTAGATVAWDLDGDSLVDAVGTTATFTYNASGSFVITANATLNCRTASAQSSLTVLDQILQAPSGSGSFTSFFTPPDCSYFDLQVNAASGITVTAIGFRSANTNVSHDIEVWAKSGTTLNLFGNGNYTQIASGTATSPATANELFFVDVNDFALTNGLHGLVVVSRNSGTAHTWYQSNAGLTSSDANLDMTPTGSDTNFDTQTADTSGMSSLVNSFSGAVVYTTGVMSGPPGTVSKFGNGCPGSLGVPTLLPGTTPPAIGNTFAVRVENVAGAASMHGGISNTFNATFGIPLPADLGPLLGTQSSCRLLVSSEAILPAVAADPFAQSDILFQIPNNPLFSGLTVFFQAVVFDPAMPGGIVMSDAWFGVVM